MWFCDLMSQHVTERELELAKILILTHKQDSWVIFTYLIWSLCVMLSLSNKTCFEQRIYSTSIFKKLHMHECSYSVQYSAQGVICASCTDDWRSQFYNSYCSEWWDNKKKKVITAQYCYKLVLVSIWSSFFTLQHLVWRRHHQCCLSDTRNHLLGARGGALMAVHLSGNWAWNVLNNDCPA